MNLKGNILVFLIVVLTLVVLYIILNNLRNNNPTVNNPSFDYPVSTNSNNTTLALPSSNTFNPLIDCSVKSKSKKNCDFVAAYEATKNPNDSTEKQLKIQDAWIEICKNPCFNYDAWKIENRMTN